MDSNDEIKFEKEKQSAMLDRYEKMLTISKMVRSDYEVSRGKEMPMEAKIKIMELWIREGLISAPKVIEKIVHVEIPKKSTPEELEYAKQYREWKKRQKEILDEHEREKQRVQQIMMNRKSSFCYTCKKQVELINPTCKYEKKQNKQYPHIIIESNCPFCNGKVRSFGGIYKGIDRYKMENIRFSG